MLAILALVMSLANSASARLVAHYEFEGNANDSSGHGLNGILMGGVSFVTDSERGSVLSLDGFGDYMDCGNDSWFDITSSITLACWIKVDSYNKAWQAIITKGDSAWRLQRNETSRGIEFACTGINVPGTTWGNVLGSTNVNDSKWHHVAGVYDGSRISLYIDGVLEYSEAGSGSINTNNYAVMIGENADQRGREWDGQIDDVRIYNNALSEAEIAELAGTDGTGVQAQAGSYSPIAFAFIRRDGTVASGTPNISCTYNSAYSRYEITISGETYVSDQYVTLVTCSSVIGKSVTDSLNDKLIIYIFDKNDRKIQSDFQFVTYKSPLPSKPEPEPEPEEVITELTEATFDGIVLNSDLPVLVDFWAPWYGPCLMMAPVIEEIAGEYTGKLKVCKLNTDYSPRINSRYGITAIPTIILFRDGQIRKKWIGVTSKEDIIAGFDFSSFSTD